MPNTAKFKVGDVVRATDKLAKDKNFHSDLEADLISDRASDKKITRIITAIEEQKKLKVVSAVWNESQKIFEYELSRKGKDMGCMLAEADLKLD